MSTQLRISATYVGVDRLFSTEGPSPKPGIKFLRRPQNPQMRFDVKMWPAQLAERIPRRSNG
jgi:hypothetical protein